MFAARAGIDLHDPTIDIVASRAQLFGQADPLLGADRGVFMLCGVVVYDPRRQIRFDRGDRKQSLWRDLRRARCSER
jgi:hypothetical protein